MMGECFGPKCFLVSAFSLLTILSIYGIVGALLTYEQASKIPKFGDWPFNLRPVFGAFVIIQTLFPAAGVIGLLSGCKKQPLLLYASGSVLLAIFTCCSVFGSVSVKVNSQDIINEFYKTVKKNLNDSHLNSWMDDLQWQSQCCGIYDFRDWYQIGKDARFPSSCCKRDKAGPGGRCDKGISTAIANPSDFIYTTGCGKKISTVIQNASQNLGIEILVAGGAALIVAIFLFIYVTKIFLKKRSLKVQRDSNGNHLNPSGEGRSSTVDTSGSNDVDSRDANNNAFMQRKGTNLQRQRLIEKHRRQGNYRHSKSRLRPPFGPLVNSQSKFKRPSSKNELNGNISASKSFILGEARSYLMSPGMDGKDTELFRKNVDMLWYQSRPPCTSNMSTLSTTPNESSYMTFPSTLLHSKRGIPGPEGLAGLNEEEQRNMVYTLVSERPFTPSSSQNCSVSGINNNQGKVQNGNGEAVLVAGQGNKQLDYDAETPQPNDNVLIPSPSPAPFHSANVSDNPSANKEERLEESGNGNANSLVNTAPPTASTIGGAKYNPSSVRSSTLATIQEESESTKCSPTATKAASPASGYMSPEGVTPQQTEADLSQKSHEGSGNENFHENICNNNSAGDNESFEKAGVAELSDVLITSGEGNLG